MERACIVCEMKKKETKISEQAKTKQMGREKVKLLIQ